MLFGIVAEAAHFPGQIAALAVLAVQHHDGRVTVLGVGGFHFVGVFAVGDFVHFPFAHGVAAAGASAGAVLMIGGDGEFGQGGVDFIACLLQRARQGIGLDLDVAGAGAAHVARSGGQAEHAQLRAGFEGQEAVFVFQQYQALAHHAAGEIKLGGADGIFILEFAHKVPRLGGGFRAAHSAEVVGQYAVPFCGQDIRQDTSYQQQRQHRAVGDEITLFAVILFFLHFLASIRSYTSEIWVCLGPLCCFLGKGSGGNRSLASKERFPPESSFVLSRRRKKQRRCR